MLFCFDESGRKLWERAHGTALREEDAPHSPYPGACAAPTLDGNLIYLLGGLGKLSAYSTSDGESVWTVDLVANLGGRVPPWGYAESVLIDGDRLICTPGGEKTGTFAALDKRTGSVLWQSGEVTERAEYASPILIEHDGVRQGVTMTRGGLVAVSPEDGTLLWQHDRNAGKAKRESTTAHGNSPAFADSYVFEATSYETRGGGAVALRKSGSGIEAKSAWEDSKLSGEHGGHVVIDGHVYPSAGPGWTCLDLKTGEERWAERGPGKGSIIYADGMLYCLGENGKIALIEANPESFEVTGQFDLPRGEGKSWAHPAISDGKLYLRWADELHVYAIQEAALLADARMTFKKQVEPFVKAYCTKCHGGGRAKANISFEVALKDPGRGTAFLNWKKAVANVMVHDMPPEEDVRKIPTDEERRQFAEWIGKLKYLSPKDPGPFVIRRLTPVEYGNTLRDLYGVDPSIGDRLPEEVVGEGYLNSISPLQSELFLELANKVVEQIVAPEGKAVVQKRLFGEAPLEGADLREAARKVARSLARDAYRRPPTEAELNVLVDIFDLARENELDYTESLALMLKAVLVSPQFLFITPAGEVQLGEQIVRVDDHQLASRLSYLLWSAPPDAELSALADKGELHQLETLRAQAERLLMHPRARALYDSFGAQWLRVNDLKRQVFDPDLFPQMTPALRKAMMNEPRLFFES